MATQRVAQRLRLPFMKSKSSSGVRVCTAVVCDWTHSDSQAQAYMRRPEKQGTALQADGSGQRGQDSGQRN